VVPATGQSVVDVLAALSPEAAEAAARLGPPVTDDGRFHPDLARAMFCNDMDDELTSYTLDRMVPEAVGAIAAPADLTGLASLVPRTYVRLLRDAAIVPAAQDHMIANLGGADVVDLDAGHMAMISQPDGLAAILNSL
jgi:pimeloyl-ACP methyl ester carboxylesterase